ncbi:MAG: LptF/LptG family permease [Bacteroidia bacterium]|nr:LptF/LptG family permease [Bacteroidia bacterium]
MKKLHWLVIKSYLGPFTATFFVAVFLLLMQFLWKYVDELVGKGLPFHVIAELMLYASATMVPMALPLAILISSIMTFGNLGERYELVALKSSGISLQRIMFPLVIVSVIISIAAFLFSNNILPVANLKFAALLHDIRQKRPALDIKEGIFYNGLENFSIKVAKKDKKTNMLYNIMIYDHRARKGNVNITIADSAVMKVTPAQDLLILTLYHGFSYEEVEEESKTPGDRAYPHNREKFDEETITVGLEGYGFERTDESLFKDGYRMLTIVQLGKIIDSLKLSLDQRKTSFSRTLLETNYFRKELKKPDSLKTSAEDKSRIFLQINIDSLFNTFPQAEKLRIIAMAANYARSAKTYISTTGEEYDSRNKWIYRHEIAWHKKLSLSVACLVLFFIGAPLGAIIRKGGIGMPIVVSVFLFIIYYIIDITGEKIVKEGVLPAYEGMWLSTVVFFPFGIFLTYKATNDSAIMNIDTYFLLFRKIYTFRKFTGKETILTAGKISDVQIERTELLKTLINLKILCSAYREKILNQQRLFILSKRQEAHEGIEHISELYNSTYIMILRKYNEINYIRQKIEELPEFRYKIYKKTIRRTMFNIFAFTVFIIPAGLFIMLYFYIKKIILTRKLLLIEDISQQIINILENPAYFELRKAV